MSSLWIKISHDLPDKPEVSRMADILDSSPDEVVGLLVRFWIWMDINSVDGKAYFTDKMINRFVRIVDFALAMREVGWLEGEGGMAILPNFDRHNSKSAKKRAMSQQRMEESRKRNKSATGALKKRNQIEIEREIEIEKKTERKNKKKDSPSFSEPILLEIFQAYPKRKAKISAFAAIQKALVRIHHKRFHEDDPDPVSWLLGRVKAYSESRQGENAEFTPYPASWFNAGSYDDESFAGEKHKIADIVPRKYKFQDD